MIEPSERIEEDGEGGRVLKTSQERCKALAARAEALHPYGLPEVALQPVEAGGERGLAWILSEPQS